VLCVAVAGAELMPERGQLKLAEPVFGPDAVAALEQVLASGRLTQGPRVEEFESAIADFCGTAHAIAVTSATTALELALAALDIGPGSEVLVADFTYPATGNAVLQRGARLRLVDVDPETYCIDVDALASAIDERTSAVITVDVFGLAADYGRIEPLLAERGIPLICDAACALGGAIAARKCGSFGQMSAFSFHPRKSLTTGEGGMVTTDDAGLAARMRRLRNHGTERDGWRATFIEPGFNFRMSELQAALGLVQIPSYPDIVARRRYLAGMLGEVLRGVDGVTPQAEPSGHLHPYQSFVVTLADRIDRDSVIERLLAAGVESTLGTYAMHAEPAFGTRCGVAPGDLEHSYRLLGQTLALPLHQGVTEDDLAFIAVALEGAIDGSTRGLDTTRQSA
jgi:perosamine synthetase